MDNNQTLLKRTICVCLACIVTTWTVNYYVGQRQLREVKTWLEVNSLKDMEQVFMKNDLVSFSKVIALNTVEIALLLKSEFLHSPKQALKLNDNIKTLSRLVADLRQHMQFRHWIHVNRLLDCEPAFYAHNIRTLPQLLENIESVKLASAMADAYPAIMALENDSRNIGIYPAKPSVFHFYRLIHFSLTWLRNVAKLTVVCAAIIVITTYLLFAILIRKIARSLSRLPSRSPPQADVISRLWNWLTSARSAVGPQSQTPPSTADHSLFQALLGNCFDANRSFITWLDSDYEVGHETSFRVTLRRTNFRAYNPAQLNSLRVEIKVDTTLMENRFVYGEDWIDVLFTPVKAGSYSISVLADGGMVQDRPLVKVFKPGAVDAHKSRLVVCSSLLVMTMHERQSINIDERDKYGNECACSVDDLYKYEFHIFEVGAKRQQVSPELTFEEDPSTTQTTTHKMWLTIRHSGVFNAIVYYDDEVFHEGLTLLVLTSSAMSEVLKNIDNPSWNLYYDAYNVSSSNSNPVGRRGSLSQTLLAGTSSSHNNAETNRKKKKVYCYINSKMLIIKEFYLKFIPKKLASFRINPSVKITLLEDETFPEHPGFEVTSRKQTMTLYSRHRDLIVATFEKQMLKNIGGSQSFEEKRKYFYNEITCMHPNFLKVNIEINRPTALQETWRIVKSYSVHDWWKKWNVRFIGEQGLDCGGLTRELMQLLTSQLLDGLFTKFNKEDAQALVHPRARRSGVYKNVKMFELFGMLVAKCLLECSADHTRQLYVKARFTRSFLSLVLGMNVHWQQFSTDDKQYYSGKIKYIQENDPAYLDIYFTEDLYDNEDNFIKTIDLISGGTHIQVLEHNKELYLQRLAEYRLADSIQTEVDAFVKGLQFLMPDGLLSMFDETELELLMCGMEEISVSDWKENCQTDYNDTVCTWFWAVLAGFNQEELSRVLQFATGCSQLPPEGFRGLEPKFKIMRVGAKDNLPTSHTCFNTICLPDYSSRDEMKKKLLIAINEASEGFGLT